jgi:hypothetical protein
MNGRPMCLTCCVFVFLFFFCCETVGGFFNGNRRGRPIGSKKRFGPAGRQLVQDITKLSFSASFLVIYWDFEFSQMQSPISYMIFNFFSCCHGAARTRHMRCEMIEFSHFLLIS